MNEQAIKENAPAKSSRRRARELALQGIYQWKLTSGILRMLKKRFAKRKGRGAMTLSFAAGRCAACQTSPQGSCHFRCVPPPTMVMPARTPNAVSAWLSCLKTGMDLPHGCRSQACRAQYPVLSTPPSRTDAVESHRAVALRNLAGTLFKSGGQEAFHLHIHIIGGGNMPPLVRRD